MFPVRNDLKQGDALTPLLFNFALEYAIRRFQESRFEIRFWFMLMMLIYWEEAHIL
jgi:hypothetical protein